MFNREELVDALLAAEDAGDFEAAEAYQGMIDDMDDAEFEYLADAASPGPEFKIYA